MSDGPPFKMGKKEGRTSQQSAKAPGRRSAHIQAKTPFPFLSLPPELRQQIYRNLVVFPNGVREKPLSMDSHLNIFLASRQLYAESSEIFYAENAFLLNSRVAESYFPSSEPFSPTLNRVRRCILNIQPTTSFESFFLDSYLSYFVDTLMPEHKLRYLLIVATSYQVPYLTDLEKLSGVGLVQIDVAHYGVSYWRDGSPSTGYKMCIAHDEPKVAYQQHLERLMMSDGSEEQKKKTQEELKGEYDSEPAFPTALVREELDRARWKGVGELIYSFNKASMRMLQC